MLFCDPSFVRNAICSESAPPTELFSSYVIRESLYRLRHFCFFLYDRQQRKQAMAIARIKMTNAMLKPIALVTKAFSSRGVAVVTSMQSSPSASDSKPSAHFVQVFISLHFLHPVGQAIQESFSMKLDSGHSRQRFSPRIASILHVSHLP